MESNTIDSGSRVTRSLRKRLASIDSDNGSRPGTPVVAKLQPIVEQCASPSRSTRSTRRNSTSGTATPVKTPIKRITGSSIVNADNSDLSTPSKRITRRRSLSGNDNEQTLQLAVKVPCFPALTEESVSTEINSTTTKRITRSQSKSPQQKCIDIKSPYDDKNIDLDDSVLKNGSSKRRKPGPKSKTQYSDDLDVTSDVEISVVGKDDESNQMKMKGMNNTKMQDASDTGKQVSPVEIEKNSNTTESGSSELSMQENQIKSIDKYTGLIEGDIEKYIEGEHVNETSATPHGEFSSSEKVIVENKNNKEVSPLTDGSQKSIEENKNNKEVSLLTDGSQKSIVELHSNRVGSEDQNDNTIVNKSEIKYTDLESVETEAAQLSNIASETIEKMEDCINPQDEKILNNKIEIISISTLVSNQDVYTENLSIFDSNTSSKKVDFTLSPSNDKNEKTVYPKTPASSKTRISYDEIDISDKDNSFQAHNNLREENAVVNTCEMTPTEKYNYTQKLQIIQSSTPINIEASYNASPQAQKSVEIHDEIEANESVNNHTDKEKDSTQMIWINPNVKGKTFEGCKLDELVIEDNKVMTDNFIEAESKNTINEDEKVEKDIISEYSEEEFNNQELDDDDDECEELAPGEKEYKKKHDFHDDEALEVEDYESGNSMDSEERKEMIENEIPIDGYSIGSHTTDDENDICIEEGEDDETNDSFIVSDNNEAEFLESDDQIESEYKLQDTEHLQHNNSKKKKTYKRLQLHSESSSSADDVDSNRAKLKIEERSITVVESSSGDGTKLQKDDGVENIYKHSEENSVSSDAENNEVIDENQAETNSQCTNPNSKLSGDNNSLDSSKLSDSDLRLQCSTDNESEENNGMEKSFNTSRRKILRKIKQTDRLNKSVRDFNSEIHTSLFEDIQNQSSSKFTTELNNKENSFKDTDQNVGENVSKYDKEREKRNKSSLEEISTNQRSDDDKDMFLLSSRRQVGTGLSTSFESYKKNHKGERKKRQRSFTTSPKSRDSELNTKVNEIKPKEMAESSSPEDSLKKNEDIKSIENSRRMSLPLGNPLFRTRRQSLALPTNPNMGICASNDNELKTKLKPKNLGIFSNNDYKPSQSYIESIELDECHHKSQMLKRKRLSKSFCGASESLDNSVIDIDVRHLDKRSKITSENSIIESCHNSNENINTTKISTKKSSIQHKNNAQNSSLNNIQHILNRCDEILEAANRAKLESKTNSKKSKVKPSKKQKKRRLVPSQESKDDDVLRKISKEIKHKTKTAVKTADKILNNKPLEDNNIVTKRLPSEVLEGVKKIEIEKKLNKKEINKFQINEHLCKATVVGNFVEMPRSPEKRKKKTEYIQLPTGKISVEPVTPKKRLVQACNGTEFRESPVTPFATGFKVREIPLSDKNSSVGGKLKSCKRKRYCDEPFKQNTLPKPQWTQSGLFLEEEIPIMHKFKLGKCKKGSQHEYLNTPNSNFKQKALMRSDVTRTNNREALLLRERRHAQGRY